MKKLNDGECRIGDLQKPPKHFDTPYEAGHDCGQFGANDNNCQFKWFATRKTSDDWSRGELVGKGKRLGWV